MNAKNILTLFRRSVLSSAALLLAAQLAHAAPELKQKAQFNIQPQLLTEALIEYSRQSGIQVSSESKLINGKSSGGVTGALLAGDALARLLKGTGLIFEVIDAKTVAIRSSRPAGAVVSEGAGVVGQTELHLARADDKPASKDDVEEMLVEGEREKPAPFSTGNLDLTRTEDDVLPFTTFTARDIELSGAVNLQEFLQNRLPQNLNHTLASEVLGTISSTAKTRVDNVNLRGWGATETVFLLNGRRLPPQYRGSSIESDNATPNLSMIPLALIERIEILPSAGSAIYGEGATGGVINIITRRDYHGGQMSLSYETPADVHRPHRGIDMNYGMPLKFGMSLRLSAAYDDSEPLRVGDRSQVSIERWRRLVVQRNPSRFQSLYAYSPPVGATPNITSASYVFEPEFGLAPLFGPGSPTSARVRAGSTGTGGLSDITLGEFNFDLAEGGTGLSYAKGATYGFPVENTVINVGLDKKIGSKWLLSFDYNRAENDSSGASTGTVKLFGITQSAVPAAAPTNPFGQDLQVALIDPLMDRPELRDHSIGINEVLSSTLTGQFGEWRGFLDLSYTNNRYDQLTSIFWAPTSGWNSAFLTGAYNPFLDGRVASYGQPGFYDDYVAYRAVAESGTRSYSTAVKMSGPMLQLPAGPVQLTAGVDWSRSERHKSRSYSEFQDPLSGAPVIPVGQTSARYEFISPMNVFDFDNYGLYTETTAPLLSPQQGIRLARKLELFASGRAGLQKRNSSSRNGSAINYENKPHVYAFGFRQEMIAGMTLRASKSIGFKPPTLYQIETSLPTGSYTLTFSDPRRGGEQVILASSQTRLGGNPDLKAETTASTNFGVVLSPEFMANTRISIDYLDNLRNDAISNFASPQQLMDMEADFPGRVGRGAPDGHPSGVGRVELLDYRLANFWEVSSRSIDISIEHQLSDILGGRLIFTAAATRNLSFKVQLTNTAPAVERLRNGNYTFDSNQIAWNANGQLSWQGRRWSFGWSTRYFDYLLVEPDYRVDQGSDRADWALTHDAFASFSMPGRENPRGMQGLLAGTSISFGIKNVLDREPRFWALALESGVAPYDSIVGRSVWLKMSKSFGVHR